MKRREEHARELHQLLSKTLGDHGVEVRVEGRGISWHVDAASGDRRCRVYCLDYNDAGGVLVLGRRGKSHLSSVRLGTTHQPRRGAEYCAGFLLAGEETATGRTQDVELVIPAVSDWVLSKLSRDQMYERHDFVDAERRACHAVADGINVALSAAGAKSLVEHEDDELWIYAGERSVCLEPGLEVVR